MHGAGPGVGDSDQSRQLDEKVCPLGMVSVQDSCDSGVNEMFAALSQAAKRSTLMAVHSLVLTQSLSIPFRSASIEELGSDELGFEASNQRLDWCR